MHIEVDQSIRIDNTQKDTVLAFSNEISGAVRIPARVKRTCLKILRGRGTTKIYPRIFAVALLILLKENINKINEIVIDTEFSDPKNQRFIKAMLLKNLRKRGSKISPDNIAFRRIGKKSRAHEKAYKVHKGKIKAEHKIGISEILNLI
jgi:hypothetical protein